MDVDVQEFASVLREINFSRIVFVVTYLGVSVIVNEVCVNLQERTFKDFRYISDYMFIYV